MRILLIFAIAVSLGSCSLTIGQTPPPPAPARPIRTVGKAEVFYFKNSDTSRVSVDVILLGSHETILTEDYFSLGASFSNPGAKLVRPRAVSLRLYSYTHGTDYRFKVDNRLAIFLDNKPFLSGRGHESFLNIDPRGAVTEYYSVSLAYDDFLKIIKSKVVALKFGGTRFELKQEQLDAFGDIDRAIK